MGPSWRQVGLETRWKIDPKRFGRFHIALRTFQEAPERESLIFQWFWEVWVGVSPRARGRAVATGSEPDPLNLKDKPNTPRARPRVLGQGQVQVLGPRVFDV